MKVSSELQDFATALIEPVLFIDGDSVVQWANAAAHRHLADSGHALAGVSLQVLVEDSEQRIKEFIKLCSRTRRPVPGRLHWRSRQPDASTLGRCTGILLCEQNPEASCLLCIRISPSSHQSNGAFQLLNRKLEKQDTALRALASSQEQLQLERDKATVTLYSIGDAVITTDAGGRIERLNHIAAHLTGWQENEAVGQRLRDVFRIINEETREPAVDPVERCLREGRIVGLANHTLLVARDGTEYAIEDSAAPILQHGLEPLGAVLVFRDVTAERLTKQQLQFLAQRDPLTTLNNRRYFEEQSQAAYLRVARDSGQHALIYIDLDQFKLVNDTAGHHVGDQLLVSVSRYLIGRVRGGDVLARLGGDEFGLLASDIDEQSALTLAEDIIRGLQQRLFKLSAQGYRVSASAGVAMIDRHSWSASEALREADIACYIAKHAGRGVAHLFSRGDHAAINTMSEMELVNDIRDAITENRLHLVFQPIVMVPDGQLIHYEVLLRMTRRDGAEESPTQVIGAAERYGMMGEVDRWVIEEALSELAAQHRCGNDILLTINLSGVSMGDRELQKFIINALERHQVSGECIVFEVTETAAITGMERASGFMQELKEHGCRFALDDFGTGFSSFSYLKHLPLTYLKIDGSFIRDVVNDPVDQAMVRSMTAIASSMGMSTVAESVESQEILDSLRDLGVHLAQGFHICRPLESPSYSTPGQSWD